MIKFLRIYAVAHYLDPRFKDQFVPNRLQFVSKIHSWIKSDILLPINNENILIEEIEKSPSPKKCGDFFASRANKFAARKTPTKASSQPSEEIEFELNLYRKADLESLDSDSFDFWKENERMYPILSNVVRCYLSASSSTVESERIFSVARDVFDYRRNLLNPKRLRCLFF